MLGHNQESKTMAGKPNADSVKNKKLKKKERTFGNK
jgi:hypothetical protein